MDVRDFVKKQDKALKRYRRLYKLLNFTVIALALYLILFYINVDRVLPLLSTFEVRAGTAYNILGFSVAFEFAVLALIAAFCSLIITLLLHLRDARTNALYLIEQKHPELRERLRTAYDNASMDNLVVSDLLSYVSDRIRTVNPSELLIKGKLIFGIILILVSSTTLVYVVENDIRTDRISPEDIKDMVDRLPFTPKPEDALNDLPEFGESNGEEGGLIDDQRGDIEFVLVEGQEVDLVLPPGTEGGFTPGDEAEETDRDFVRSPPHELEIISSQAYYEELPPGYESVIKSYFEEMAQK